MSAGPAAPTPSSTAPASAGQSVWNRGQRERSSVSGFTAKKTEAPLFPPNTELVSAAFALFSSTRFSLIKNALGTDSPAFIIYYTSSLFMIDEKRAKNRTTKLWLVCAWATYTRSRM